MRGIISISLAALALLAASPCLANDIDLCTPGLLVEARAPLEERGIISVRNSEARLAAAPDSSSVSRTSGIEITADEAGGKASLKLGGSRDPVVTCSNGQQIARMASWSVTIAAPLDKEKTDGQTRATLDGLTRSTSLDLNFRVLTVTASGSVDKGAMRDICAEAFDRTDAGRTEKWTLAKGCGDEKVREWAPELLPAYESAAWGANPSATVLGGTGKIGQEDFEWYEPATLAKLSDHRTTWSAKVYFAYKPLNGNRLFTFQYERQLAWEGQEEKILCPVGGPTSSCVKGAPGKPKKVERDLFGAELRQQSATGAFALNLTYDAANDVAAVGLPVYLSSDETGWIGGIRFDWRSDTGESKVGIFVGTPLNFALP